MPRLKINNHNGFTLLELMLAVAIFAVVSLLATGGMSNVLNFQKQSQAEMEQLNRLQMFFSMLSRELNFIVIRPVREEYGTKLPAISSETSDGLDGLEFTHQGQNLPGQGVLLQRVAYYQDENKLYKKLWPVLDRAEDTESSAYVLLNKVERFTISYMVEVKKGQMEWQSSLDSDRVNKLRGIKIELDTQKHKIYRIFPVRS